jgi:hypothetical protein
MLPGEPARRDGEPSMVYRGRLMYWHLDGGEAPDYDSLDIDTRSRWTMLASSMEHIVQQAPRVDPPGGFTARSGGPGLVGSASFD